MAANALEEQENIQSIVRAGDQSAAATKQMVDSYASAGSSDPGLADDFSDFLPRWEKAVKAATAAKDSWLPSFLSGLGSSYDDLLAVAHQGSSLYARAVQLANQHGVKSRMAVVRSPHDLGMVARVQNALNSMRTPPPNAPLKVDNNLGRETRKALSWFQAGHGMPQTGQADKATINALAIATGEGPLEAAGETTMHGWIAPFAGGAASTAGLAAAYHAWRHHRGKHAPTVAAVPGVPAIVQAAVEVHGEFGIDVFADLSHDRQSVAHAQQQLGTLGYRVAVDGGLGPETGRALSLFQATHNLHPTGKLDIVTSSYLEIAAAQAAGPSFGFEWTTYLLGLGTLPLASVARQYVHNLTGGPAGRMYGEEDLSESDVGFEWTTYALGLATLPALNVGKQYLHNVTGGPAARVYGEEDVPEPWELEPQPWELESTPTQDILFGDTMMSLPADNLGRVRA